MVESVHTSETSINFWVSHRAVISTLAAVRTRSLTIFTNFLKLVHWYISSYNTKSNTYVIWILFSRAVFLRVSASKLSGYDRVIYTLTGLRPASCMLSNYWTIRGSGKWHSVSLRLIMIMYFISLLFWHKIN